MRKYILGTGIIGAVTSAVALLRGMREDQFTWRTALAWASWGITLALAIGSIRDVRRASRGIEVPSIHQSKEEHKLLKRHGL